MTMKQHFPQFPLAVLLALTLVGCHGPVYENEVYDEAEKYEYDHEDGNTINGWTVECDGPEIILYYGGVLNTGQIHGNATIKSASYRNLQVNGVTFYNPHSLYISNSGNINIYNFECITAGNVDVSSEGNVTASNLTDINLSVSALNGATSLGNIFGGSIEISGKSVALSSICHGDGFKIQASDSVLLQAEVNVTDDLSVSRIIQQGYMSTAPNITIGGNLMAGDEISLSGINIEGTSIDADLKAQAYHIKGDGFVNIQQRIVGGIELTVTAKKNVQLGNLQDISRSTVLTSTEENVSFGSFSGTYLEAIANKKVTATGVITASGTVTLTGSAISVKDISADGGVNLTSLAEDISIAGDLASSGVLDSAGAITIGSFNGESLSAKAKGNVTLGTVGGEQTSIVIQGSSISTKAIDNCRDVNLTTSNGDITITGDLVAAGVLDSAGDVTITGKVEGTGNLLVSAKGAIHTGKNPISGKTVTLVSGTELSIESFTSGELVARSGGTLTLTNCTASIDEPGTVTLFSSTKIIIGVTDGGGVLNDLWGNFNVTYTGTADDEGYEVDVNGWVHGDFNATALTGGVNVGRITGNATVESQQIYLSSLTGGDIKFSASDNVTLRGNVTANHLLQIDGKNEKGVKTLADITIESSLTTGMTGTIKLDGKNINGTVAEQTMTADFLDLRAANAINIRQTILGNTLYATGLGGVTLGALGDAVQPIGKIASIASDQGSVTIGSFTGVTLDATAFKALTVEGNILSTGRDSSGGPGNIYLKGASVSAQTISAEGKVSLQSTGSDYAAAGGRAKASISVGQPGKGNFIKAGLLEAISKGGIMFAGDVTTDSGAKLEAEGDINLGDEAVVRGSMNASAEGDITMEGFFYDGERIEVKAGGEVNLGSVGALQICEVEDGPVEDHPVGDAIVSSTNGPVTIYCFAGRTLNASAGGVDGALTVGDSEDDAGIDSTGKGMWNADGSEGGPYGVRLRGTSITAQHITSAAAVYLESTGFGSYEAAFIEVNGDISTNALHAHAGGNVALLGRVDIKGNGGPDSIITTYDQVEFGDRLTVESARLDIMNIAEASSLKVADVTIGNGATIGVYTGATAAEDQEGTLTIAGDCTLTAGAGARLNADLVMEDGSTLNVSAAGGVGGLLMGSTVTLNPGETLSDADMAAVAGLEFMQAYDLFSGVDGLNVGNTAYSELLVMHDWVNAAEVFANPEFEAENQYFLFYSGTALGGAGERVGTVYLMRLPEPATGGLSLLALALLASRRKRR